MDNNKNKEIMNNLCPISSKTVNENSARVSAFIAISILTAGVLLRLDYLVYFLLIDFFLRGFIDNKYSPIAQLSIIISKILGLKNKTINAGPKIFSAQVGFFFTLIISSFLLLGFYSGTLIVSGILIFCSFLEFAFGFCVACKLYPYFAKAL